MQLTPHLDISFCMRMDVEHDARRQISRKDTTTDVVQRRGFGEMFERKCGGRRATTDTPGCSDRRRSLKNTQWRRKYSNSRTVLEPSARAFHHIQHITGPQSDCHCVTLDSHFLCLHLPTTRRRLLGNLQSTWSRQICPQTVSQVTQPSPISPPCRPLHPLQPIQPVSTDFQHVHKCLVTYAASMGTEWQERVACTPVVCKWLPQLVYTKPTRTLCLLPQSLGA